MCNVSWGGFVNGWRGRETGGIDLFRFMSQTAGGF